MGKRKPAPGPGLQSVIRGERVREIRERRGWTQMELAYRAKLHATDISSIERCMRDMNTPNFLRLVVALETSSDYLLGLTDSPGRPK